MNLPQVVYGTQPICILAKYGTLSTIGKLEQEEEVVVVKEKLSTATKCSV